MIVRAGPQGPVRKPRKRDSLADFLYPLSPETFFERYWGICPVHIRGTPGKFSRLFSRGRFDRAIRKAAAVQFTRNFRIGAIVEDFDGSFTCTESIEIEDIAERLADGTTVCVHDVALGDGKLAAFGETVRRRSRFAGTVSFNCYLSPPGSGADTHFDRSVTTAIQIEGRKRWLYGKAPVLAWPPANARMRADGSPEWTLPWLGGRGWDDLAAVDDRELAEVILEPGDILCLPAGTWHSAKAVEQSLALNMTFSPTRSTAIIAALLEELFEEHPAWRAGPPPVPGRDPSCPREVVNYFSDRLGELRRRLASFDSGDPVVTRLWRDLVEPS